MPSLIAAGYKDWDGHGRSNKQGAASGWSSGKKPEKWQQYDDQARLTGEANGINVGRIPWKTKIAGKLKAKCSNNDNNIQLGSQSWTVGRKNWWKNKKLYGEIKVTCQNSKTHTLYLKWDDETQSKKGWYGLVK